MTPESRRWVAVEAVSSRYRPDDRGWRAQVVAFHRGLREAGFELQHADAPTGGTKGSLDPVIVTLASSGVLTAAVGFLREWVRRDRDRTIRLTVHGTEPMFIEVTGENISDATIRTALGDAIRRTVDEADP